MAVNEILQAHSDAIGYFNRAAHAIRADQWDAPTPCTEWSVRDLVNHLTVEQLWVPPLVADGKTVAEVGDAYEGDQLGADPLATWDRSAADAAAAFGAPGALNRTVHLSYGDSPCSAYLGQMTTDATVHGWDLARAVGTDERMPDGLAAAALREVTPYANDLAKSGLFAAPVEAPADADDQTRLLCLLGRRP